MIGKIIYEYSYCIGYFKKNYKCQWNELHECARVNNGLNGIKKAEHLLKNNDYYIDQWSDNGFQTALYWAVMCHYIEMIEFLLINGARRKIKIILYELESGLSYSSGAYNNDNNIN